MCVFCCDVSNGFLVVFFFLLFVIRLNHSCFLPKPVQTVQWCRSTTVKTSAAAECEPCRLTAGPAPAGSPSLQVRVWIQAPQAGAGLPRMHRGVTEGEGGGHLQSLVEVRSRARITAGFSEPPQKKKMFPTKRAERWLPSKLCDRGRTELNADGCGGGGWCVCDTFSLTH